MVLHAEPPDSIVLTVDGINQQAHFLQAVSETGCRQCVQRAEICQAPRVAPLDSGSGVMPACGSTFAHQARIPKGAALGGADLGCMIHMHDAEPLAVAMGPFEVVQQRPDEIAVQVDPLIDCIR